MKKESSRFKAKNFQVMLMLIDAPCVSGKSLYVVHPKIIIGAKLQK